MAKIEQNLVAEAQSVSVDKQLDIEALRSSQNLIDCQRDMIEKREMKEMVNEIKALEECLEKILIRTTNRYLKKGARVEPSREPLKEPVNFMKRNGSEIFSSTKEPPVINRLKLPVREQEMDSGSKNKEPEEEPQDDREPSKRQSLKSENSLKQGSVKQKSTRLVRAGAILKGAVRYNSNLSHMLMNQLKQSKVITGKREI